MEVARGVNDVGSSTLIILGGKDRGTGFHLDWTQACNVAFAVGADVAADTVLAVWVFINPLVLHLADAWVKLHVLTRKRVRGRFNMVPRWPEGFASSADHRVHLIGADLDSFLAYMRGLEGVVNPVVVVEQKAGQMVCVPAGWAHQVTNQATCLKVAWDYYDAVHLHNYVQLQQLASTYFKASMSHDYMSVNMIIALLVGDA